MAGQILFFFAVSDMGGFKFEHLNARKLLSRPHVRVTSQFVTEEAKTILSKLSTSIKS